jgi:hypothetical protein
MSLQDVIRKRGPAPLHLALAAVLFAVPGQPAAAQTAPPPHLQVISANPFGLLLEFFNAEYERVVTESTTAGIGGSTFVGDEDGRYVNADVFWRFYPTGTPLDGWSFGAKVGLTSVQEQTHFGYGFDVNRSWLLGANNNFYVGIGFGLKRLVGDTEALDLSVVPTFRIVNVGIAF